MTSYPIAVLVLSGKRKSGKDYIAELLSKKLGKDVCSIMRLSAPLKGQYAKEHSLEFDRLLDSSDYKEKFRADMIVWGENKRNEDPGYFCRLATSGDESEKYVWIISDARRSTDVEYFSKNYPHQMKSVRIVADIEKRKERGFVFTKGVDDVESECGLDTWHQWDIIITNNGDDIHLEMVLSALIDDLKKRMPDPS